MQGRGVREEHNKRSKVSLDQILLNPLQSANANLGRSLHAYLELQVGVVATNKLDALSALLPVLIRGGLVVDGGLQQLNRFVCYLFGHGFVGNPQTDFDPLRLAGLLVLLHGDGRLGKRLVNRINQCVDSKCSTVQT